MWAPSRARQYSAASVTSGTWNPPGAAARMSLLWKGGARERAQCVQSLEAFDFDGTENRTVAPWRRKQAPPGAQQRKLIGSRGARRSQTRDNAGKESGTRGGRDIAQVLAAGWIQNRLQGPRQSRDRSGPRGG